VDIPQQASVCVGALGLSLNAPVLAQDVVKIGSVLSARARLHSSANLRTRRSGCTSTGSTQQRRRRQEIELVVYDDGGDANKARTFATRLIETTRSSRWSADRRPGTSMAMIPVFEEAQVPFISLAGGYRSRRPRAQIRVQDAAYRHRWLAKRFLKVSKRSSSRKLH